MARDSCGNAAKTTLWEESARGRWAVIPDRLWYGHKAHVGFEDILRSARPLRELLDEVAPLRRAHDGRPAPRSTSRRAA